MGIVDEDVARVRESTDIVALVSEHLALKRVGRRYVGLCPFHQEKTPSFNVNPEMARYYCFGCNASGDAISFVRELEHLDFVDAVERLASRAGIQLRYDDRRAGEAKSRQTRLREVVDAAIDFYHALLLESERGWPGPSLPPEPGVRRRGGAAVPARLGTRRLGRARAATSSSAASRATTSSTRVSRS